MSVPGMISSVAWKTLGRAFCIITGASKGLGRTLAHQVACLLRPGSILVLVARSRLLVQDLKEALEASTEGRGLTLLSLAVDLGTKEGVKETVRVAQEQATENIDHMLVFNNASSLGDMSWFAGSFTDLDEVNSYMSFNVSSPLALTTGVLQAFPSRSGLRRTVVNISSVCATNTKLFWVLYCTGKAAREMAFRVLAEEEPDVWVLNYSPGAMVTDLQKEARAFTADVELCQSCCSMNAEGQLLSCQESGAKLLQMLLDGDVPSGSHLDFFDD